MISFFSGESKFLSFDFTTVYAMNFITRVLILFKIKKFFSTNILVSAIFGLNHISIFTKLNYIQTTLPASSALSIFFNFGQTQGLVGAGGFLLRSSNFLLIS